jgi:diketogulonate reductase-like aldo/keto reductase
VSIRDSEVHLFQELLGVLSRIAAQHDSDIASVATRVMLDRDPVAAAIVGAVNTSHLASHARIGELRLHLDELSMIANFTDQQRGPAGDIYDLERDREGAHGRIMKYELNALPNQRTADPVSPGVATPDG